MERKEIKTHQLNTKKQVAYFLRRQAIQAEGTGSDWLSREFGPEEFLDFYQRAATFRAIADALQTDHPNAAAWAFEIFEKLLPSHKAVIWRCRAFLEKSSQEKDQEKAR